MSNEILNGRYQVLEQLGRQTGRKTLLALDLESSQQVVVKLLHLGQDFDWQDLKLFEREAETLKALDHPAIPRYLDYFEFDTANDKGFGLVQSYVSGKSLEEHLQAGRTFSEAEVKELARSLLSILEYLHEKEPPIIHRDIKPSNILLTNRSGNSVGQVYLVDFGSVQNLAAKEGGTITVVGTYGYMPPEQFGGRTSPASDLYSLGATLIYLATGMHPTELPQQELQIQFREFANLSLEFADWLEWMTEPSLQQRVSSTQQAIQGLENPRQRKKKTQIKQRLKQPTGSKIRLIKTNEMLEIILPPKGLGISLILLLSVTIPPVLAYFFAGSGFIFINIAANIVVSIFGLMAIVIAILWGFFKCTRMQIVDRTIVLFHDLLGIKWRVNSPINSRTISEFELNRDRLQLGDRRPSLRIVSGSRLYYFDIYGYNNNLTNAEIEWLVQEVGSWLKLPSKED